MDAGERPDNSTTEPPPTLASGCERGSDLVDIDTPPTIDGTISLNRCHGCSFEILRHPGIFTGNYRLTHPRPPSGIGASPRV